jgi:hypothetical protein
MEEIPGEVSNVELPKQAKYAAECKQKTATCPENSTGRFGNCD